MKRNYFGLFLKNIFPRFWNKTLKPDWSLVGMFLLFFSPLAGQNLLLNGGFENGKTNWSGGGVVSSGEAYEGGFSLYFNNHSSSDQMIYGVSAGLECKVSAWVFITPQFIGDDWGGIQISVKTDSWQDLAIIPEIEPYSFPVGEWFQVISSFVPTTPAIRVTVGLFGGGGWNPDFYIDDVRLFYTPENNEPPVIHQMILDEISGTAPFTVIGEIIADDGFFGAIVHSLVQTGDGGIVEGSSFSYTYPAGGQYQFTAIVVDDEGAQTTAVQMINVAGDPDHILLIEYPTTQNTFTTGDPSITIGGNSLGGDGWFFWINTRTAQSGRANSGNQFLFEDIALEPGENIIHLQSCNFDNRCIVDEINVMYEIPGYSGPQVSNFQSENDTLLPYQKYECRFDVLTTADNPWFPFDENLPPNTHVGKGISVDAVFTSGETEKRVPAFYDMDYENIGGNLRPVGRFTWKVRMAFDTPGTWQLKLEARDDGGSSEFLGPEIIVEGAPEKPGFIKASPTDNRYFEFDDGTFFNPMGHGIGVSDDIAGLNEKIEVFTENGLNFSRTWLMDESPFSDAWSSWATHHNMSNNGYMPPPLYSINQHYKNGDYSWRVAAPAIDNQNTPAMFRGFWDQATAVKPSTTYRLLARVKTINLSGNGGLVLKTGGWLGQEAVNSGVGEVVSYTLKGNNNWVYLIGEYTTQPWETTFPYLYLVLEDINSGEAYLDQLTIQELLPDGSLSANILAKPAANVHYYLDPIESRYFDNLVEKANETGIYLKVPILEKDDWILNHIEPLTGLVTENNGRFDAPPGSKLHRLYQYYWRYLIARWGFATAIHSWELVNEGAPSSYFELLDGMADYFDQHSPYPRMVSTSFWSSWEPDYWAASKADYADVHAYIMTTGWINNYTIDGQSYTREQLRNDAAAAVYAYSDYIFSDPQRNKPVVLAETDLDQPGNQSPDPLLADDTEGVWLHNFNWGHINHGGIAAMIWNDQNIENNNLYYRYKSYMAFMQDIPLNNGLYVALQKTCSNPQLRVWGQQQTTGEAAHCWIQNKDHTWHRVVTLGNPQPESGTVSIAGLKPGAVEVTLWDSWGEATEPYLVFDDTATANGQITIQVTDLQSDMAVKIKSKPPVEEQIINLSQGWQGVSSFLIPLDNTIETMLNELLPGLEIMYGPEEVFWPLSNVYSLSEWDEKKGYVIKMNQAGQLQISGFYIEDKNLEIPAGWSLIPVLSNCPALCAELFGNLSPENTILIKEVAGTRVYWPEMQIFSLLTLEPGKAYWIYVTENTEVEFPDCE